MRSHPSMSHLPMKLLEHRVPLSLLIDLAEPAGPRSVEILRAEQIHELLLACPTPSEPVAALAAVSAG